LVYCAEGADNDGRVRDVVLPRGAELSTEPGDGASEAAVVISARARRATAQGSHVVGDLARPLRLVPYFTWANRGPGEMQVWLAEDPRVAEVAGEDGQRE
jgi:hypothetical protein